MIDFYKILFKKSKDDGIEENNINLLIFNKNNEVLLLKRKSENIFGGYDEFLNINIPYNENIYNLIVKETKSKFNLDIKKIIAYINNCDYISKNGRRIRQLNFVALIDNINNINLNNYDSFKWEKIENILNDDSIIEEIKFALSMYYFNLLK